MCCTDLLFQCDHGHGGFVINECRSCDCTRCRIEQTAEHLALCSVPSLDICPLLLGFQSEDPQLASVIHDLRGGAFWIQLASPNILMIKHPVGAGNVLQENR